jgi:hypothetical protein
LFGIGLTGLQAQTTVNTGGGNTSGAQGSVNYTIGQTVYTTTTGTDGSVAQGVQQPFEISVISGIDEAKSIGLNWTVHPNPVADNLRLTLGDLNELYHDILYYQLIDISGKILVTKQITASETTVPMNGLVSANYFLRVYSTKKSGQNTTKENQKVMKTFKILKK